MRGRKTKTLVDEFYVRILQAVYASDEWKLCDVLRNREVPVDCCVALRIVNLYGI